VRCLLAVFAFAVSFAIRGPAAAEDAAPAEGAMAMDHHHHHHDMAAMSKAQAVRSVVRYEVPNVVLRDAQGRPVSLRDVLAEKDPLMLNFIYTSCTSVCPAMSGTFSQVQSKLGKSVRLVSISIDPEYDTPDRLKAYAMRFSAGSQWTLLTGSLQDSIAVQRAFSAYRGDKMDHVAATFLRADPDQPWVRLDGLASADDLIQEYHRLVTR
jgi:protein SCO1/2